MKNKINVRQLRETLREAIIHKYSIGECQVNIRLNSTYNFYYNFDSCYNPTDLDFVFLIEGEFEKLQAIDENDEIIENQFDEEYLASLVDYYSDCIFYELENLHK